MVFTSLHVWARNSSPLSLSWIKRRLQGWVLPRRAFISNAKPRRFLMLLVMLKSAVRLTASGSWALMHMVKAYLVFTSLLLHTRAQCCQKIAMAQLQPLGFLWNDCLRKEESDATLEKTGSSCSYNCTCWPTVTQVYICQCSGVGSLFQPTSSIKVLMDLFAFSTKMKRRNQFKFMGQLGLPIALVGRWLSIDRILNCSSRLQYSFVLPLRTTDFSEPSSTADGEGSISFKMLDVIFMASTQTILKNCETCHRFSEPLLCVLRSEGGYIGLDSSQL